MIALFTDHHSEEREPWQSETPAMMVRPLSKPPPSATARKSCGCQTSTPTLRRIKKSLAGSVDMRMLGREREKNSVSYLSHLCTPSTCQTHNMLARLPLQEPAPPLRSEGGARVRAYKRSQRECGTKMRIVDMDIKYRPSRAYGRLAWGNFPYFLLRSTARNPDTPLHRRKSGPIFGSPSSMY